MTKSKLSNSDKKKLSASIGIPIILIIFFSLAFIVLFSILAVIMLFVGEPAVGFDKRFITIIGIISVVGLLLTWNSLLEFIDLKLGSKFCFTTSDYELVKRRNDYYLKIKKPFRNKFLIDEKVQDRINPELPIHLEIVKLSKSIIQISQDNRKLFN